MKFMRIAALVVGGLLPFAVAPAGAETLTFDWTLSATSPDLGGFKYTGEGTFTAITTGTPGVDLAKEMTGEVNGINITGLLAPGTFGGNDNLLFPNGATATDPTFLDGDGISFAIAAGDINVYSFGGSGTGNAYGQSSPLGFGVGHFDLTATPLPPTWTMMIAALFGFGFIFSRKKKPSVSLALA